jgi:hypothetical protein
MPLNKDWREFIELLNWHGVEYLVVGAFAVAYHGFPRYTGDLDLLIQSFKFQGQATKLRMRFKNRTRTGATAARIGGRLRAAGFNRKEALNLRGTI